MTTSTPRRRRPATGLQPELQQRFTEACNRAHPGRRYAYPASDWADYYAHREPILEEALGGICWDFRDRAIVAATTQILHSFAGTDLEHPKRHRAALAASLRTIADMIEEDPR